MQRVGTVVQRNLVGLAVERELASGDPIPIAPDDGALTRVRLLQVPLKRSKAQHDILYLACAIRGFHADQMCSIRRYSHLNLPIGQRVNGNSNSVRSMTPNRHLRFSLCNGRKGHCHCNDDCNKFSHSFHGLPLCLPELAPLQNRTCRPFALCSGNERPRQREDAHRQI